MKPLLRAALLGVLISVTTACQAESETAKKTAEAPQAQAATVAKAADAVKAENPFVRAVPPGQPNSAAFMVLNNSSAVAHQVVSATSPVANTVELHTHTNNNGVMEMRQIPQIDVPANGKAVLAPGGLHIMLIELRQELKAGESVAVTLTFEDGSTAVVDAPIQEVTPPMGGMKHH
ncbi:copper chaperone PCu(A)C [Thiothrix sp.]|uniref:copper chaperone PCu(A)C n=1 Tax=Thiothrix sp. TaxID=1032 RepID=UPI00257CA180|nr:copper chaperone PCu(A)C [Thiothrix sp.]